MCSVVGHVYNAGEVERQPPQVLWLDYAIDPICPLLGQGRHVLLHSQSPRHTLVSFVAPGKSLRVFRQAQKVRYQASLVQYMLSIQILEVNFLEFVGQEVNDLHWS